MKNIVIFAVFGLLTACVAPFNPSLKPHPQSQAETIDRQQFIAAVDRSLAEGRSDLLPKLQQSASNSVCGDYAAKLLLLAKKQIALAAQLQQEKSSREQLQQELSGVTEQNEQLSKQLEQLKRLLIEFERKAQ